MNSEPVLSLLREALAERRRKNPRFSLRAYARLLAVNPATLSQLLRGKRPLTLGTAAALLGRLGVDPAVKEAALLAMSEVRPRRSQELVLRTLAQDELRLLTEWHHYAVLSALEIFPGGGTAAQVARQIGVDRRTAADSLATLLRLGFVTRQGARYAHIPKFRLSAVSSKPSAAALLAAIQSYIKKSSDALSDPRTHAYCDYSASTLAACKDKIPEARRRITEFRRELALFLNDGPVDTVLRINVQLFPLM